MFPDIDSLRRLEKKTLRFVTQISEFGRLGDLQAAARKADAAINEHKGGVDIHLGFKLDMQLRGDKGRASRRVDVGALIQASPDQRTVRNASYSLVICRYSEPTGPILRKLHFDYEPRASRNLSEPKPSIHMQLCGKFGPHHHTAGYTDLQLQRWYPRFEKPRIPLPPTSIALILNWLLLEFQSDPAAQPILRSTEWRAIVTEAERTVLGPYYLEASEFLASAAKRKQGFVETHLYEGLTT